MKIELVRGKKQWFWRVIAKNGEPLLTSEMYASKWNAKRQALKLVRANGFAYREVGDGK